MCYCKGWQSWCASGCYYNRLEVKITGLGVWSTGMNLFNLNIPCFIRNLSIRDLRAVLLLGYAILQLTQPETSKGWLKSIHTQVECYRSLFSAFIKGDLVGDFLFERFVLYQVQCSSSPQLPRKVSPHLNKCLMYSERMGPNKSGEKNIVTTTHIQFFKHSFLS